MKKTLLRVLCAVLVVCALLPLATACKKKKGNYSNEETPLVLASEALDGVFNPFFYTSGADGSVVSLTQIGMLNTDQNGKLACGWDEDCVTLAYTVVTHGSKEQYDASQNYDDYYTEYSFAIKNGIKFSNGETLSGKDVLFNLYTLLDPSYTGSSTLYSVNIKGLKAYRAQTYNENEQDQMDAKFTAEAVARLNDVLAWCRDEHATKEAMTDAQREVIAKAKSLFHDELVSDWASADSSKESYEKYGFTETWQVFLYLEGFITVKTEKERNADGTFTTTYKVDYNDTDKITDKSKEALIERVFNSFTSDTAPLASYKDNFRKIIGGGTATASNLREYYKSVCISEYFKQYDQLQVPNISGITLTTGSSLTDSDGSTVDLGGECEILKIVVNGVDPKAIYNFSFTVTPMSYYSTEEEINKYSYENNHFGVAFADSDFFEQMQLKQVPVGAGPYKATTANTDCEAEGAIPKKNDFFRDNIVYYERNNNFYTVFGSDTAKNAKIRKVRYKVISTDQMYNAVTGANPEVYYSEPQATPDNMKKLADASGIGVELADNLGYGYIGINAKYVKEIEVRRAIMYCLDTSLCVEYYGSYASAIYRSMSSNSWAYPKGCMPYYAEKSYDDCKTDAEGNVISIGKFNEEKAQQSALAEVQAAGYTTDAEGKLVNAKGERLTFTFTIAGDSTDHPAWRTMAKAADLLNEIGFDVTVTKDANALSKLSSGTLAVWAAAWSSTIDPDMYQVYHKDSSATSIRNWGFPYIMEEGTGEEQDLLDKLAELIEDGRATIVEKDRKDIYSDALDTVMELAVECPTYQRKNLYIWNSSVIDSSTLCKATAYQSPFSHIWEISFIEG